MKKKKILYIVPRMNFFSEGYRGRVMHALGICEGFADNGWDVTIVGGDGIKNFQNDLPKKVRIIQINEPKVLFRYFLWWVKIFYTYLKLKNKNIYEVVLFRYVFSSFFLISLMVFVSSKIQQNIIETNGLMSQIFKKKYFIFVFLENYFLNLFNLIYVDSLKQKEHIFNLMKIKKKVVFIPNGCTRKKIKSTQTFNSTSSNSRLVFFGTLLKTQKFDLFAKFINKLNKKLNLEVLILGDGPQLEFFKKKILNKNFVLFYGQFSRNDLGSLINPRTDILILPEQLNNIVAGGFSTKLFDYMSTKLPILAPRDRNISSILINKYNSLLYKPGNFKSFYSCYKKLNNDPKLKSYLGKNSYNDFKKKHTWKIRMKDLIDAIQ